MKKLKIGICGWGTVATALYKCIETNSEYIIIKCRDHEYVDGDRIRLMINGAVIHPNISLSSMFYVVDVDLDDGYNNIDFIALNEGESSPNTAQLIVQDEFGKELSNKKLADFLNISEEYVGQYFKNNTGYSPQDYIELRRMEEAIKMLRSDDESIKVIGMKVGFKDTAYFCRRFKLMFGVQAGKMRKRLNEI